MFRLYSASQKGELAEMLKITETKPAPWGPFDTVRRHDFVLDHEDEIHVDLYCHAREKRHLDLIVEVKDWDTPVSTGLIHKCIDDSQKLKACIDKPVAFLFYSEKKVTPAQRKILGEANIITL